MQEPATGLDIGRQNRRVTHLAPCQLDSHRTPLDAQAGRPARLRRTVITKHSPQLLQAALGEDFARRPWHFLQQIHFGGSDLRSNQLHNQFAVEVFGTFGCDNGNDPGPVRCLFRLRSKETLSKGSLKNHTDAALYRIGEN